jgi:phosphate transport system ATP-binding protein
MNAIKLETNAYSLFYGKFHALEDISLKIPEKQVTAIIGPSGCGKSTFLRTFNRMNDLIPGVRTEGQALLDGEDIFSMDVVALGSGLGWFSKSRTPFPNQFLTTLLMVRV